MLKEVERLLGATPTSVVDITSPWGSGTRTQLLTLARGEQVVLQRSADRAGMGRRIRLGRELPLRAPALPIASVIAADTRPPMPFAVTRFANGISGAEMLGTDRDAIVLADLMGRLVPLLAAVPTRGLRLSTRWSEPEQLADVARRWLARGKKLLGPDAAADVERLIEEVPGLLGDAPATFAHGDFAPVNVIVHNAEIVALIDLERARVAHPLFDPAWWRLMVRFHHPQRWAAAASPFFATAGVDWTAHTVAQLDLLAVLQCLELVSSSPRRQPGIGASWAARLQAVLGWSSSRAPGRW